MILVLVVVERKPKLCHANPDQLAKFADWLEKKAVIKMAKIYPKEAIKDN
jgi:hypothetical protein